MHAMIPNHLVHEYSGSSDPIPDAAAIEQLIVRHLKPYVTAIDLEGKYPETFLRMLGSVGGFGGVVSREYGGNGQGLAHTLQIIEQTAKVCVSSAFLIWCQTACLRYVQSTTNIKLQQQLLPELVSGRLLGGTGLSNTLKSHSGIERPLLKARRITEGYSINGNLPWVSNLGEQHVFVTGCPLENDGRLVFFVVDCSQPGFRLVDGAHFTALEGTATRACQFRDYQVPDSQVLAHAEESAEYLEKIKSGMILGQVGLGLGLIDDCIKLVSAVSKAQSSLNQYLDDQADELTIRLASLRLESYRLAALLDNDPAVATLPEILRVRLTSAELALRAAQAAMLHQGAKGFLTHSAAQRRLREAYFIAIVTPAIKHLRRELAQLATRTPAFEPA